VNTITYIIPCDRQLKIASKMERGAFFVMTSMFFGNYNKNINIYSILCYWHTIHRPHIAC
jgi:hypothetical protein